MRDTLAPSLVRKMCCFKIITQMTVYGNTTGVLVSTVILCYTVLVV